MLITSMKKHYMKCECTHPWYHWGHERTGARANKQTNKQKRHARTHTTIHKCTKCTIHKYFPSIHTLSLIFFLFYYILRRSSICYPFCVLFFQIAILWPCQAISFGNFISTNKRHEKKRIKSRTFSFLLCMITLFHSLFDCQPFYFNTCTRIWWSTIDNWLFYLCIIDRK